MPKLSFLIVFLLPLPFLPVTFRDCGVFAFQTRVCMFPLPNARGNRFPEISDSRLPSQSGHFLNELLQKLCQTGPGQPPAQIREAVSHPVSPHVLLSLFPFRIVFLLPLPFLPVTFLFSVFSIACFPPCFESLNNKSGVSVFPLYGVYFEPHIYIYIYIYMYIYIYI